jgi:DNA-binding CsgD family transcriptional regulator
VFNDLLMGPGAGRAFVGRETELAAIGELLTLPANGRAAFALCRGDAGIGKTRLAEELGRKAEERGYAVAWGVADDTVGSPPYWPWMQVLRSLVNTGALEPSVLPHEALARLLPERPAAEPLAAPSADDRFHLFDAVSQALRAAARACPVAIVLDDMHWSDEGSLLLLRHVTLSLPSDPLLLWVNARPTELPQLFDGWARLPHVHDVRLGGLDDAGIRSELEAVTGAAITDSELAGIASLTAGNPFLVREAAFALLERRAGQREQLVSRGSSSVVAARLARLAAATQRALAAAAVLGSEFDVELLADVLGVGQQECLAAIGDAHRAGLVEPGGVPTRYRFAHALIRDATEQRIDAVERASLHRASAISLERRHPDEPSSFVFEIAQHWAQAATVGDRATAAAWLTRAGDLALAQLGYENAARLYQEAVSIGGAELTADRRCELLLAAARACNSANARSECHRLRSTAIEVAPAHSRLRVLAEAALAMDPVGDSAFDLATRRYCTEVLGQLEAEPTSLRARLTARYAETFIYLPPDEAADAASEQALEVAAAADDRFAQHAALRAKQVLAAHPDRVSDRDDVAGRLIELGRSAGDVEAELRGRLCRVDVLFQRGDLGGIAAELDRAAGLAELTRRPLNVYAVAHTQAVLAQAQGRAEVARRISDEAFARGGWGEHPDPVHRRTAVRSGLARWTGPDPEILQPPPDAAGQSRPPFIGDLAAAHALACAGPSRAALELWRSLGPPSSWRPPAHVALLGPALGLEAAILLQRREDVAALAKCFAGYRGHHVACGLGAASYLGPVELWLGKSALYLDDLDQAVCDLTDAVTISRAGGAGGAEAEALIDLAAALLRRGNSGCVIAARGHLADAAAIAEQLRLTVLLSRVGELSQQLDGSGGPLTEREREVAALVARGLSNRQIAERLVLSERTAQNHVQHILGKLGLRNRGQIATWVKTGDRSTRDEYRI